MTEPHLLLARRRWLGSLALCAGVLVTLSTSNPYFIRTDVPLPAGSEGAAIRIRGVLVVLPPPWTTIQPNSNEVELDAPWGGAPVLTLWNEGSEPVVLRTARVSVEVEGASFADPRPSEHEIAPGERRSVRLTLQAVRSGRASRHPEAPGRFCFGELVFPDGTSRAIEGELRGLQPIPAEQSQL